MFHDPRRTFAQLFFSQAQGSRMSTWSRFFLPSLHELVWWLGCKRALWIAESSCKITQACSMIMTCSWTQHAEQTNCRVNTVCKNISVCHWFRSLKDVMREFKCLISCPSGMWETPSSLRTCPILSLCDFIASRLRISFRSFGDNPEFERLIFG